MAESFFDGLMVVELADRRNQYLGKLLSDAGARVLQVEPLSGSAGRWCGPFVQDKQDPDRCLDYWYYNTGKYSVCIDIAQATGRDLVRGLAAQADVFLESWPPGRLQRWNLGYEQLARASGERLIYASITDFGQDGPWKDYVANDVSHLALGGQMASSGYSDPAAPPMGGQGHQAWHLAGVLCLQAIVMSLMERMDSGQGQHIDCSIHDCCAISTELAVPKWVYETKVLYRHTGQHAADERQAPTTLPCADGAYVNTRVTDLTQYLWVNLLGWMQELGVAEDLDDPKYMDKAYRAERWRYGSEIRAGIARLLQKIPAEEAMYQAQSRQLPWAVVRAPEENYDEPHWNQRGFFVPIEHPALSKSVRYPRGQYLCQDAPIRPQRRAPNLAEHTTTVLKEVLGLGDKELQELRDSEVVR